MTPAAPRRALSAEDFERLLRLLHADRDEAARRYEALRRRLIKIFGWRGCAEPETLADEAFDRVARRLGDGVEVRHEDPYAYFHGVAQRIVQEQWRKPERERRVLEHLARAGTPDESGSLDAERRLGCLERCLGELGEAGRGLLRRYHAGEKRARIEARQGLAAELGLSASALRIKVFRLRAGLLVCIEACLEPSP